MGLNLNNKKKLRKLRLGKLVQLKKLGERFDANRILFEAPHAIGYDTEDKVTRKRVFLWCLRQPVKKALAEKLVENVVLPGINTDLSAPQPTVFGIAGGETIFYATEQFSATSILERELTPKRKSLMVARCIRFIAHLHETNYFIGCLHDHSFIVTREDTLLFNGLFPAIPGQIKTEETSSSLYEFTAPELRSGSAANFTTDVFALGAYIYRLVGGHEFPVHLDEQQLYQHLRVQIPIICSKDNRTTWLAPILEKMLQWRPEKRYQNAVEAFADTEEACPELGVFGAGPLKSIDNAATSYIMSPFTQVAVAAITVGLTLSVIYENFANPNTIVIRRHLANATDIAELGGGGAFKYKIGDDDPKESDDNPSIKNEDPQEPVNQKSGFVRVKIAREDVKGSKYWTNDKNSALVHILRYGTFDYDPEETLCHWRHIGRRRER